MMELVLGPLLSATATDCQLEAQMREEFADPVLADIRAVRIAFTE